MDKTNKQLLIQLRKNGRAKLSVIHRATKIPVTTVFERLKKFTSEYVDKYAVLLDWQKAGFGIRVVGVVKANNHKTKVQDFLLENKNINSLSRINNNFNFLFEAIFSTIKELEDFNEELCSIKAKTKIFFIVETIREEFLFTKKEHLKLL